VGVRDSSKRTLGAPVVVSFDMDGLSQGLIAGEQVCACACACACVCVCVCKGFLYGALTV